MRGVLGSSRHQDPKPQTALMRQFSAGKLELIEGFVEKGTALALERARELDGG